VRFKPDVTLEELELFRDQYKLEAKRLRREARLAIAPTGPASADFLAYRNLAAKRLRREARLIAAARPQTVGQRIDALRRECGWTLEELAEQADVQKSTVYRNIHGKRAPRPSVLRGYAGAFTRRLGRPITVAYLLGQ
jgi:DNA-binding XRE family transcriptional regulator